MRLATSLLLLAVTGAAAEGNIRILPDQAILACHARATHDLAAGGAEVMATKRYAATAMPGFMFHVEGTLVARMEGRERLVAVGCDVSSSHGVEVFTMEVAPEG